MGGVNVKITMIELMLKTVAPHPCFGCSKIGTALCPDCKYNIISEPFYGCILCGNVSPEGVCAQHDTTICKAWVVGIRHTILKQLIDAYKFQYTKQAAHAMADLLDERLPLLPLNTIIVPVPTASSHIRQRGYDHIDILARLLAQRRNLRIQRYIERSSSATQHYLTKEQRQKEAMNAFHVSTQKAIDPATPLLLLDDIITTGATISSAASVLAEAGVKTIFVGALAYQPLD
jgi:ComF family protein